MKLIRPRENYIEYFLDAVARGLDVKDKHIAHLIRHGAAALHTDPRKLIEQFTKLSAKEPLTGRDGRSVIPTYAAHAFWYVPDTGSDNPIVRGQSIIRTNFSSVDEQRLKGDIFIAITPRNMRNNSVTPAKMLQDAWGILDKTLALCRNDHSIFDPYNKPEKVLVVCERNSAVEHALVEAKGEQVSGLDYDFGRGTPRMGYWMHLA